MAPRVFVYLGKSCGEHPDSVDHLSTGSQPRSVSRVSCLAAGTRR
jgi:hypothetical protein